MTNDKSVSGAFTETPEVKATLNVVSLDDAKSTTTALNHYFSDGIQVVSFDQIPLEIRLSFVQKTPACFIKTRRVGGTEIPYVDHYFAEKCLNFVSNFRWGSKLVRSDIKEEIVQTRNGEKKAFDAMVEMDFWIELGGKRIERFIVSGHRMFESPATTRADALKSAVSKANTVFARQLGVGANIIDEEGRAYDKIASAIDSVIPKQKFNADDFTVDKKTGEVEKKKSPVKKPAEKKPDEVEKSNEPSDECLNFLQKISEATKIEEVNEIRSVFMTSATGITSPDERKHILTSVVAKLKDLQAAEHADKKATADDFLNFSA